MHEIDEMLKLQLEGKHEQARKLSDKLENIGREKILDGNGKNTEDIWLRHSFNRGWFLIQEGKYQEGSKLLENGRFLSVYGNGVPNTKAPLYNPSVHSIRGKTIIISLEGGFGDEMIHARFAKSYKDLGAERVYLACSKDIDDLFKRVPGVDGVILRNEFDKVEHDFWVPGFSAGWVAGHTFEDFPNHNYLSAKDDEVRKWSNIIKLKKGKKFKVGIRWAGNPKFEHQQFRRFPPEFLINLTKYKDLDIYSLQKDHNVVKLPKEVTDLQDKLNTWDDTAAAIMNLDLVITSCTSIAHLSAAMGKETWVMVPCLPYHTWTYGAPTSTTSPYYKTAKIFRQRTYTKWNDTFTEVYKQLEKKFSLNFVELPNEDKEFKRLNLGCGFDKFDDYVNVDIDKRVEPDVVLDLNKTPWPFKDEEFSHIVAKNVLEYLGDTKENFYQIIKEMYRVSSNSAIWEIQIPHWNSDLAKEDPYIKRVPNLGFFRHLNMNETLDQIRAKKNISKLAFDLNVDMDLCDVQFMFTPHWQRLLKEQKIKKDEVDFALQHYNNVAYQAILLVQVHKPGRCDLKELNELFEWLNSDEAKRTIDTNAKLIYEKKNPLDGVVQK
mgnify:CR=1 FL=1